MSLAFGSRSPRRHPPGPSNGDRGPVDGLCSAVLATLGFVATFALVFVGASVETVFLAALIAIASLGVEIHSLNRLP